MPVAHAIIARAMPTPIGIILRFRAPHKIAETIVGTATIQMPAFHLGRAWADKGFQDQMVNRQIMVTA